MNRDRQLKKDMESREVQIHEEYEKNRHLMSEDKGKSCCIRQCWRYAFRQRNGKEKIV